MDELLQQFLIEGRDLVAEAHGALLALGRDPGDRAALDSLFRATHTLKGSVALFDMAPAETLLHVAEGRLDLARKGEAILDEVALDAFVAVIDQTDRWVDAMERDGVIGSDALATAKRLQALLSSPQTSGLEAIGLMETLSAADESGEWIDMLLSRSQFAAVDRDKAQTMFRYEPDPDCFFRGEDPLALVASVPDLLGLAILPSDSCWQELDGWQPFRCNAVLEGVSGADIARVRAVFRFVPDQIQLASCALAQPEEKLEGAAEPARESTLTLRVDAAKLDRLADRSGELAVAIRSLEPLADRLRGLDPKLGAELHGVRDAIERIAGALKRSVAQVRLVPLEPVLRRLPRLAREAAATLDKSVRFTLAGESIEVDKQIADQLFEPLLHLVRNAIDHGVEHPDERAAVGKPREGRIALTIAPNGDKIVVTLVDDGRGIDAAKVRDAAVARGLLMSEDADALGDDEARGLIFMPGFSTADHATNLSGRGVGMDAVQASVNRLGGSVRLESEVGKGTRIRMSLPVNAIATPLLVVEAGGQKLGLRLDHVVETTRVPEAAIHSVGQGKACILRDATVPVVDLADLLGLEAASGERARLIIVDVGGGSTALRVSEFGERVEASIAGQSGLLSRLPAIAGTTMMADGSILLVLDLPELIA